MVPCLAALALLWACGAQTTQRHGIGAPGGGEDRSGTATAPGIPEPSPDDHQSSRPERGEPGKFQEARQLTGPVLYAHLELEAPTVTAEVVGSSIFFTAEGARGHDRTVVELEGIGFWEAVAPVGEGINYVFTVPAPALTTVRWRAASAAAPESAGGRYRMGPWTNWSVLQVPPVVPPDAGVERSELN